MDAGNLARIQVTQDRHRVVLYRGFLALFFSLSLYTQDGSTSLNSRSFTIVQAVFPSSYSGILLVRREDLTFKPPKLLERRLESSDLNGLFCLFADPLDQYPLWKVLSPTFMGKILPPPFTVGINVLCFFIFLPMMKAWSATNLCQFLIGSSQRCTKFAILRL